MKNKRKKKNQILLNPKFWKIGVPLLILIFILVLGSFGYYLHNESMGWSTAFWKSVNHIDTSFIEIPKGDDTGKGILITGLLWLSRIAGVILIPYAFFLLIHQHYRESISRLRIGIWKGRYIGFGYLFQRKYAVICGLGWRGCELARQLLDGKYKVIGIDIDTSRSKISELKLEGMVAIQGDATLDDILKKACVINAREIYVVTANDEINCRIAIQIKKLAPDNLVRKRENLNRISEIFWNFIYSIRNFFNPNRNRMCYVSVTDQRHRIFLDGLFRNEQKEDKVNEEKSKSIVAGKEKTGEELQKNNVKRSIVNVSSSLHIHCFDLTELAVRNLIFKTGIIPVKTDDSPKHVHCVIFGNTPSALALFTQYLQTLHIEHGCKRKITFICDNIENEKKLLLQMYPCLRPLKEQNKDFKSVTRNLFPDLEFIELPDSNAELLADNFPLFQYLKQNTNINDSWRVNVYFCLDEGMQSISLFDLVKNRLCYLRENVAQNCELSMACYFNYQEDSLHSKFGSQSKLASDTDKHLEIFGSQGEVCSPKFIRDQVNNQLPKEIMSLYWKEKSLWDKLNTKTRDNLYDIKWLNEPEWSRESSRQAADHLYLKLAILGINKKSLDWDSQNVDKTTEEIKEKIKSKLSLLSKIEHQRWCAERLLEGWIPLTGDKNIIDWFNDETFQENMKELQRRHVDLVPFDKLPKFDEVDEQEKDNDMIEAIPEILSRISQAKKAERR